MLAPKREICLTIHKNGVVDERTTFKSFTNISEILDRKAYFKMKDGDELFAKVPLSSKKGFDCGVIFPHKLGFCSESKKIINVTNW